MPQKNCIFCGNSLHNRKNCPASNATCYSCGKNGHFSKVCCAKSRSPEGATAALFKPSLCAVPSLCHASVDVKINGKQSSALVNSCSSGNFISKSVADSLN